MVRLIEAKDLSTAAHTWRVVLYTRALAEELGVDHDTIHRLTTAAALHDVGKIDIPEAILQKPGPLTPDERAVMERHAVLGWDHLKAMDEQDPILLNLVRHHHERFDGKGYPDKLAGEAIPLGARFFSVIDSFDAMTSLRPYRAEVGDEAARKAVEQLRLGVGNRYHAEPVDAFIKLFDTGKLDWILHYFNDLRPVPEHGDIADVPAVMKRFSGKP